MPPWIFRRRILIASNLAALAIGALLIGQSSYVPTYAQGVLGYGAVLAGLAMGAMVVGWPIAATLSPKVYLRIDYRPTALLGSTFTIAGCLLFVFFVHASSGLWRVAVSGFVLGLGMGFVSVSTVVVGPVGRGLESPRRCHRKQHVHQDAGSAVGIAVFGSIANSTLADRFRHPPASVAGQLPRAVDAAAISFTKRHQSAAAIEYTRVALFDAVHYVFWALLAVALLGLVAHLLMPARAEELQFDTSP